MFLFFTTVDGLANFVLCTRGRLFLPFFPLYSYDRKEYRRWSAGKHLQHRCGRVYGVVMRNARGSDYVIFFLFLPLSARTQQTQISPWESARTHDFGSAARGQNWFCAPTCCCRWTHVHVRGTFIRSRFNGTTVGWKRYARQVFCKNNSRPRFSLRPTDPVAMSSRRNVEKRSKGSCLFPR